MANRSEIQRTMNQLRDSRGRPETEDARSKATSGTDGSMPEQSQPTTRKARVIPFHAIPADPLHEDAYGGSERSPLLTAALGYARRGWPVLPLHSIRDGCCTCGGANCERAGKHPLVMHGVKDATTDEKTIRSWWTARPSANVGVATGASSGLVALDVDPARGGDESWRALKDEHGPLPSTAMVETGGGGMHVLFAHPRTPVSNRVSVAPGLDVRADGGYVVAAPSLHASGRRYEWRVSPEQQPLAEMPDWLLGLIRRDDGGDEAASTAHSVAVDRPSSTDSLPEDWAARLRDDRVLSGYWTKTKGLNGPDRSMSAFALAIANRLVREYGSDTDQQRIAALDAFYKAHGRVATLTKLRLTLEKAKADARQPIRGGAVIRKLADVAATRVRWLDAGRIPLGTLTILDGDPGVGKTTVALDYGARVSTGRDMPDGSRGDLYEKPAGVVILSAEDDPAITLRPKLDAMGADVARIALLEAVRDAKDERLPNLADLPAIEDAIRSVGAKLVIVDPLMAYLPGTRNAYRDQDMRAVLSPLVKLAGRLDVAVLVIRHLTKQTGEPVKVSALYRGGGSIGIAGAARSVLLVAPDDTDKDGERRVMVRVKGNLSKPPSGLLFRLTAGGEHEPAIVGWEGEVDEDANDLLRPVSDDEEPSKVSEAIEWLRTTLALGPMAAKQVYGEAAKVGIARRTLERAKKRLGVRSEPQEGTSPPRWLWVLAKDGRE